jgi:deazaflavin-dependent oxidoreductase (nitroreductase family)
VVEEARQDAMNDWNSAIIREFRANGGKVGGNFSGDTLLLLTTTGAKTGRKRTNPLVCAKEGDRIFIFASKAGAPTSPDWYHNLLAHPDVQVEIGAETFNAEAVPVGPEERSRIYAEQAARDRRFAEYQQKTSRAIPVVEIKRRP